MSLFTQSEAVKLHGLSFEVAAVSEQGPRSENQDAYSTASFGSSGLVAVADGMGGERSGRVAADAALEALERAAPIRNLDEARRAVRSADAEVSRQAETRPQEHGGMGCALGLLSLTSPAGDGPTWIGAHVGDVRIISRSPDGAVRLETRDHTPAFARWEAGEIALDEIADSAGANRLQRAVGRGGEADVTWLPARAGWAWLIISDGIYKAMRMDELAHLMAMPSAAAACDALRRKVEERGPDDNYTAVLVRALGGPSREAAAEERTEPMIHTSTSHSARPGPWPLAATVLALLALALAGYAAWAASGGADRGVDRGEVERLRIEVDSLRAQVRSLADPFAPGDLEADTPATGSAPAPTIPR